VYVHVHAKYLKAVTAVINLCVTNYICNYTDTSCTP